MHAATGPAATPGPAAATRLALGALAGLAGGLVFGLLLSLTGMIGLIGALAGQLGDAAVGWALHLLFSALIGALFGLLAPWGQGTPARLLGLGAAYGLLWWVMGPMVLMPMMLGRPPALGSAVLADPGMLLSLAGHLLYGLTTAGAYGWLAGRRLQG
jgi:hypothetical protein